jgi:hypothetical protein
VSAINVTATSATISWQTNLLSNSGVNWGTTQSYGHSGSVAGLSLRPSFTITGLSPGTTYYINVWSTQNALSGWYNLKVTTAAK